MEKPNSKGRILALLRYLQDETDEEHPADKKTIMKALQDKGYSITRNTLDDDIKVLESFGTDIIVSKSHENTYFLGERKFQLPELKMLIDAISSAKFISADSKLICDNALMKNLVDHFGDDFIVRVELKETFRATVKVSVSRTFYAWVFQFAGGIRIAGPESVREEYMEMLKNAMK